MKRIITLSLACLLIFAGLQAQQVVVTKHYEIKLQDNAPAFYPVLNATGDKLLYSTDSYSGLKLYDLKTKQSTTISTEPGAGYEPIFDKSNGRIFYRKTSFVNNRRMDAMESYDPAKGEKVEMLSPRRDLKLVKPYQNGFLISAEKKILKVTFGKSSNENLHYVTTEDLKIVLVQNGNRTILNPLNMPESRYLWVSLSPDNKKILFTAAGKGTFVCDLQGKILASPGFLNAPVWYNDNFIVGMEDRDNGHVVTSSRIMMVNISTLQKTQISRPGETAMYPGASAQGKIAYNTLNGKICIAEIAIK